MAMGVLRACMPIHHEHSCTALKGQKRVENLLELELQVIVSCHVWDEK